MKKLFLFAALCALAVSAQAQTKGQAPAPAPAASSGGAPFGLPFTALGYDGILDHVTARMPLGADKLDIGVGFSLNTASGVDNSFAFGVSGFYVKTLNVWGPVSNNIAGGGWLVLPPVGDMSLTAFAGFQPEVTLLDRLILSTRFGLQANLVPDFQVFTMGDQISIVESISFKIRF